MLLYLNSCQVISTRKSSLITICLTGWFVYFYTQFLHAKYYEHDAHSNFIIQGNDMDSSRGVLSGTMDKFKMVLIISKLLLLNYFFHFWSISNKLLSHSVKFLLCPQVFETKSSRRMFTLVASFVVIFLVIYYLTR